MKKDDSQIRKFWFYSDAEMARHPEKAEAFAWDYRLAGKHQFVIVVPGGGYEVVCKDTEGHPIAEALNELGYSVFVLNYRVGKHAERPAPQDDLGALIRFVQDNSEWLNVEKDGYGIVGFSAGGHLASSFATKSVGFANYGVTAPQMLILAYPVITMRADSNVSSRLRLLGEHPCEDDMHMYSVEENVDGDFPAVFMWRREGDSVVPGGGFERFKAALDANGIEKRVELYGGTRHGGGLAKGLEMEGWLARSIAFWQALK